MRFDDTQRRIEVHLLLLFLSFDPFKQKGRRRAARKRRPTGGLTCSEVGILSGSASSSGALERQPDVRKQMFDGSQETADRVPLGRGAQILRSDVQIDLGARDEPMAEQITDRNEADAFAYEMRGEGVPDPMGREYLGESSASAECADALVECATRECPAASRAKEGSRGKLSTSYLDVLAKVSGDFIVERDGALVSAFAAHRDGESSKIHSALAKLRALACPNARSIQERDDRAITDPDDRIGSAGREHSGQLFGVERRRQLARGRFDLGKSL